MLWCRFGTLLFLKWETISFEKENWKPTHSSLNFMKYRQNIVSTEKINSYCSKKKKETTTAVKKYKIGLKEK